MDMKTWANGHGIAEGAPKTQAKVIVTGDWAPIRNFYQQMLDNPAAIYGDTLDVLKSADYRIVNLECTLFDGKPIYKTGPNLRGEPGHIESLCAGGFDMAVMANNHVCDFGYESLQQTLNLLESRGIAHAGAGMNAIEAWKPGVFEVNGIKIGVVPFSDNFDIRQADMDKPGFAGNDIELVLRRVRELRSYCDAVITIFHGGIEYEPYPSPGIRANMLRLADAEVDAVICHHPHVPQGIEIHNGHPIFYSLGNYIFNQPLPLFYRKQSFLLELGLSKQGVTEFTLHPYSLGDNGVMLLKDEKKANFMRLMERLSEPFPHDANAAWNAYLKYRWRVPTEDFKAKERMTPDDIKEAAKLNSLFATKVSQEFRFDTAQRVLHEVIDDVPEKYYQLVKDYWETPLEEQK